jgi:type VI protein secretion system component Hcp
MTIRHTLYSVAVTMTFAALIGVAHANDTRTVLTIDESDGKTVSAPVAIEVSSWSWGTSNAASAARTGGGAGKVNVQDISLTKRVSPRDAASGMPTGKRMHKPVSVSTELDSGATATMQAGPKIGEATTVVAEVHESETVANSAMVRACASGKHIAKATLAARGQTTEMKDVVVSSCAVVNNMRRFEFSGHVTLMK